MTVNPKALWDQSLVLIAQNVTKEQYNTWFKPIVFELYDEEKKTLLVQIPSTFFYEYLEANYVDLLTKVLSHTFGSGVKLTYRIVVVKKPPVLSNVEADPADAAPKPESETRANRAPSILDAAQPQDIPSHLNPKLTFENYIEGDSNKMTRSIGCSIAEHPFNAQFNPFFIYGPSGCGKTHLVNAIGLMIKKLYPEKRILYISAKLFSVQYTQAVLENHTNDFIAFYQTIDVVIIDDVQEWIGKTKTLETFFHIFNHLFRNNKRIILACDRPPVALTGLPDRMLTRFVCGLIGEMERPNVQLCVDIMRHKIRRDGLDIPDDVLLYIAENANCSVRDLQGTINQLLAYSIVYNSKLDIKLAKRCIERAVKIDDHPLTVDDILDKVCNHYKVTNTNINSKSRKKEYVIARQVSMYLCQKYTKMPSSRIGKLVGDRDHSTVVHSCKQVEQRLKVDRDFHDELLSIENSFRLKTGQR
jgi:chromosomal replication initiator protein